MYSLFPYDSCTLSRVHGPKPHLRHHLLLKSLFVSKWTVLVSTWSKKGPRAFWEIDFYPVWVFRRVVDLPIRIPNPSPTLDKNLAPMGPGILSSIGVGDWRKAPAACPDSNTTLDTFQSATFRPFQKALGSQKRRFVSKSTVLVSTVPKRGSSGPQPHLRHHLLLKRVAKWTVLVSTWSKKRLNSFSTILVSTWFWKEAFRELIWFV